VEADMKRQAFNAEGSVTNALPASQASSLSVLIAGKAILNP
jgi:hypothetical protein